MRCCLIAILAVSVFTHAACAETAVTFENKSITMIIGIPSGGGTDTAGRLVGQYLARHLPGNTSVTVRNIPGADGLVSPNYFAQQTKPDGLTVTMGASINVDRSSTVHRRPITIRIGLHLSVA